LYIKLEIIQKRREYSQPSLPSVLTHASIISNTVDTTRAILALVVDAFVNVKRTIILGVTCRTFAYIAIGLIEAITIVFAIRIEAQLTTDTVTMSGIIITLQLQVFQRGEVRILINLLVCKIV